jgi:UDP-2,4-diacetamido-2,4,6-trideoxy-beta-L-altropyranose hydrolase
VSFCVAFRVDASKNIGTGHFFRCLTLADELHLHGARLNFVSRGLPTHLRDMLSTRRFDFTPLNDTVATEDLDDLAHSNWLEVSQAQDAKDTVNALAAQKWDWLIVDHYALDARWEFAVRSIARKILSIDDLADREHDCDALLDQNYHQDMNSRYDGKVPKNCLMLLGPKYALLRREFKELRSQASLRTGEVKRILIFFGGIDADNFTGIAIEALSGIILNRIKVDVVIGALHPYREQIEKACNLQGYACHVQTAHMAELMANADLAVGAGGTAIWERCCVGLPALSICIAENQRLQVSQAAKVGLLYAPFIESDFLNTLRRHAICLMENPTLLQLLSKNSIELVDGLGATRVSALLGPDNIVIRQASVNDAKELFEWRNHPTIRAVSRNMGLIDWDLHCSWIETVLADKNRELLIGYKGKDPIGVVRFDKTEDTAEVSIYLVPDAGVRGNGRNLLLKAESWLLAHRPDVKQVRAEVLENNVVSQRLFLASGYRLEKIHYLKELRG